MARNMCCVGKWMVLCSIVAVLGVANAFASTISRTVCNHTYVSHPQIVEVNYFKPDSIVPCRVYYTKSNQRLQEGSYNNESGGCERIEKKIVMNLIDGGYVCSHSLVEPIGTRNDKLYFDFNMKTPQVFNQENEFAVLIEQFPQEEFAHMFVATLKRSYPRFVSKIVKLPEGEYGWGVLAGSFVSEQSARALNDKLIRLKIGNPKLLNLRTIARNPAQLTLIPPDWQRFAIAGCYQDGKTSAVEMARCSGLKVGPEQLTECYQGGFCSPSSVDLRNFDSNVKLQNELIRLGYLRIPKTLENIGLAQCEDELVRDKNAFANCASKKLMTSEQQKVLQCYLSDKSKLWGCITNNALSKEQTELAQCIIGAETDEERIQTCILGQYASKDTKKVIGCVSKGGQDEIAACLAKEYVGGDAKKALNCVNKYGDDVEANALCLASNLLNKDQARIVNCTTSTDSWAGFAVCAGGEDLGLNQDWMIAAECAASTSGEPVSFTACAGSRLTVRELAKCFTHGIGGDGCFGPNNTIVKHYRNMITDVTQGPGKGNEIIKLRERVLGNDNGEVARFLRDPGRRTIQLVDSAGKEFGKLAGGENSEVNKAHREAKEAIDRAAKDLKRSDLNPANWGRFRW